MFNAPQPRSRLYTTGNAYLRGLSAVSLGIGYSGEGLEHLEHALENLAPGYRAVMVPMARVGIYLALKHLIRPGQKVLLSSYTISEVINMVLCAGGVPVFIDIEEGGSYNISTNQLLARLKTETNVGAVIVTHFYGLLCDIKPILKACRDLKIPLIEDAAQAFGAQLEGRQAGALADVGIFSFGMLKTVTSFYGGAILCRDGALADEIRNDLNQWPLMSRKFLLKKMFRGASLDLATKSLLFDSGVYWVFRYALLHDKSFLKNKLDTDSNPKAFHELPEPYAARMTRAQAEIIFLQLKSLASHRSERIAKAKLYNDGLVGLKDLVLPPLRTDYSHVYGYYCIQIPDRDGLSKFMIRRLRDVQISHHRNCAGLPCFAKYAQDCPNAARAEKQVLYLPVYPGYRDSEVLANIQAIRAYFKELSQ